MPEVNQVRNLLFASAPPNVQAQAQAGEDMMRRAAQPVAPYNSRLAGLATALGGGIGGLMEGMAAKQATEAKQAHQNRLADMLEALPGGMSAQAAAGGAPKAGPSPIPGASPTGPANALPMSGAATRDLAIRTMYGEAGGESPQGQAGVAAVLKNRLASGQFGPDMHSVITAPKQFSLWNPGDPAGDAARRLDPSSPAYSKLGMIYDGVMSGQIPDPTGGATHYYNPKAASPDWGPKLAAQNDVTIGNHRFVGAGPAGPNGRDPGINVAGSSSGTLAGGAGGDTLAGVPASDGSLRGDLLAAAALHGMGDPLANGNALRRGDEMPAGGGTPSGPAAPPISPATSNATAAAALASLRPNLGVTLPAVVPDPVPAGTPDAPMPPSILPPARPPSGDVAGPASVPEPRGDLAPAPVQPSDGSVRGDLMSAWAQHDPVGAAQMQGRNVATDPVVPDPVGSLVPPAPSSPNGAFQGPQSDTAAGGAALGGAGIPAAPQASLPDTTPLPPPGAQTIQAAADATSAAANAGPGLDPNSTGPDAYPTGDGPSLRDALEAAFKGSPAPATPGQGGVDQSAGPAPVAALGATPDAPQAVASGPGADPAPSGAPAAPSAGSTALAAMAGPGVPQPSFPQPGTGAALPATGPMPPPGGQTPGAGSSLPQTGPMPPPGAQSLALANALDGSKPAPGVAPAGPVPVQGSPLADTLSPPMQPSTGINHDGGGDRSSAQAFMRQEAMRAQGGAQPSGFMGSLQGLFSPGSPRNGGTGLMGGAPVSSPQPVSSPSGGAAPAPAPLGGGTPAAPAQAQAGTSGMGQGGVPSPRFPAGSPQAAYDALLRDPMTTPAELEMIQSRMNPQPMKIAAGEGLVGRRPDGTYGELYSQASKDQYAFSPDGVHVLNKGTGRVSTPDGVGPDGVGAWHTLTPDEKRANNLPMDGVFQRGPNGELHTPGGQTINVGGEQNVYDTGMAKTLVENHQALMQGVDANRTKLRDLNLMSGALQRLQQSGGATGLGAEEKLHLQSAINTAANTLGLGQQFQVEDPEVISKIQRQISGAAAKDIGGARTTNFDMEQMLQANPGLGLSPTGNQRMLGIAQQVTQRNIDIGQQMQDAAAAAVQQGRRVDPVAMEAIRRNYDQQHHILDPITGQDLSTSPRLPEFQVNGAGRAPSPTGTPASAPAAPTASAPGPSGAQPAAAGSPVQVSTPAQAMALPPGTVFITPDGRRKVR